MYTTLVKHLSGCGAVDSALGLGPRGRRFEPFHPDHRKTCLLQAGFSFRSILEYMKLKITSLNLQGFEDWEAHFNRRL